MELIAKAGRFPRLQSFLEETDLTELPRMAGHEVAWNWTIKLANVLLTLCALYVQWWCIMKLMNRAISALINCAIKIGKPNVFV